MARSESELEGIYRFLNNPRVEPAAILEPHRRATITRASGHRCIGVAHDTTEFAFNNASGKALGFLPSTGQRGFLCHVALAVDPQANALGVLGMVPYFFEEFEKGARRRKRDDRKKEDKKSALWPQLVNQVAPTLPEGTEAIHIMDREADDYSLLSDLVAAQRRFVIRLRHRDRPACADDAVEWERVESIARRAPYICEREVLLSKRAARIGVIARRKRKTTLHLEATTVALRRPHRLRDTDLVPRALTLNLVRVYEPAPPDGETPVEWLLMTTESIETQADVEAIVDWYRARWRVEEYFKALKTGCGFEKRQLESRAAILKTLALLMPLAWQLLALRDTSRSMPKAPATSVLNQTQLAVLRAISKAALAQVPTVEDVMLAIAAQGGHLARNGAPGWQTLGRGLEKLLWAEIGYLAAKAEHA